MGRKGQIIFMIFQLYTDYPVMFPKFFQSSWFMVFNKPNSLQKLRKSLVPKIPSRWSLSYRLIVLILSLISYNL